MSISNPEAGGTPLDPAVIARMANELFAAVPGRSVSLPSVGPATPPVEAGSLPVASAIPPSSAVGPLTEVELRSMPSSVSGATLRPPQAGLTPSAVLGPYDFRPELVPDVATQVPPRGSVATPPPVTPPVEMGTLSTVPDNGSATPSEAELRALPATLVAPTPTAAPAGSSFYFLDLASAPSAAPVIPGGDYGFHPDLLPDLGLLAGPYDHRLDRRDFPG